MGSELKVYLPGFNNGKSYLPSPFVVVVPWTFRAHVLNRDHRPGHNERHSGI